MSEKTRVLVVDDNADHSKMLGMILDGVFDVKSVGSLADALAALKNPEWDAQVVLLDLILPDSSEANAKVAIQSLIKVRPVPIVVYSGADSTNALICLRNGAYTWLGKAEKLTAEEALIRQIQFAKARSEYELLCKNCDVPMNALGSTIDKMKEINKR